MRRVTLYLVEDDAPRAASALGGFGQFEPAALAEDAPLSASTGESYRETFHRATARLRKINAHFGLHGAQPETPARVVSAAELEEVDAWLGGLWRECAEREEEARRTREALHSVRQLDQLLDAYAPLDIDLALLKSDFRFLDVRVGTVPIEDVTRLRDATRLLGASFEVFSHNVNVSHVLLAGLQESGRKIDRVLAAASFAELKIPDEFAAHPDKVRRDLLEKRDALLAGEEAQRRNAARAREDNARRLVEIGGVLALASGYARLCNTLKKSDSLACTAGWVPASRIGELEQSLRQSLGARFVLESRAPFAEERPRVPSAVRHPALLRPFAVLVQTYGIPRYGEVDPTWLFAVSFVAMFGMMFGDIGHGMVIVLGGLVARRSLRGFAPFVVAIGVSSILFGFLYGSLFGYEELIHPLWVAPLSNPTLMLRVALYWGIAFIVIMTAITVRNRLREGDVAEALWSGSGAAGAVFYLGVVYAGMRWFAQGSLHAAQLALVLAPLAVILAHEWRRTDAPLAEKAIVVFIEGFDTVLGYAANTLSFLRVAAFSLNHVALAIAVFTMADMLGTAGHWLVVVLGNVFVLVLEGAIVTIQVLRLEYYEGFSRFFRGDGRAFRPLTLAAVDASPSQAAGAG